MFAQSFLQHRGKTAMPLLTYKPKDRACCIPDSTNGSRHPLHSVSSTLYTVTTTYAGQRGTKTQRRHFLSSALDLRRGYTVKKVIDFPVPKLFPARWVRSVAFLLGMGKSIIFFLQCRGTVLMKLFTLLHLSPIKTSPFATVLYIGFS